MPVTYRAASVADTEIAYSILSHSISDLAHRKGYPWDEPPGSISGLERRRPLMEHLARTADQFWIAEQDGEAVGYARSILRDGVRELTEFFVRPRAQSAGVGRELLARAFPREGAERRSIVATNDLRALARYLKSGVYGRFPIFNFRRRPHATQFDSDLEFEPMSMVRNLETVLCDIDGQVLGHCRPKDHAWLKSQRAGYVCRRGGQAVGYCYLGDDYGPIALLNPSDFGAVIAHAENYGQSQGQQDMGFEVPLSNRAAVDALLRLGYRIEPFSAIFMSDVPFGDFERYIFMSPPFFM
jgi:ribosomal protein S18 acetylase RimI-like enzyme